VPVESDGVAPEHGELSSSVGQSHEQVSKVVRKLDHAERRGTNLTGICARV
jgi:hypothetical protein